MNNILHMQINATLDSNILMPTVLAEGEAACETINAGGAANMILVCEHASNYIPKFFNGLGLSQKEKTSHAAWDPGARNLALALSEAFDAPLVCSKISRLVYDCNRPAGAVSAMPARSEIVDIPGNVDISAAETQARLEQIYRPFEQMLSKAVAAKNHPILITIHSFTPIYNGKKRAVEIGILHDDDARLADAMLIHAPKFPDFVIERNQPYGPADGVAHTIDAQGRDKGLLNVMIEVRNDLLTNPIMAKRIADIVRQMLALALASLKFDLQSGAA